MVRMKFGLFYLSFQKISYSTFCINHKSEIFGLLFHRCEDGGNKKIFHAFFTQMIYGQMAIFCKPYTSTQQRELSCVALKNETKALDELFWCFMVPHSTQKSEKSLHHFSVVFVFYFRAHFLPEDVAFILHFWTKCLLGRHELQFF